MIMVTYRHRQNTAKERQNVVFPTSERQKYYMQKSIKYITNTMETPVIKPIIEMTKEELQEALKSPIANADPSYKEAVQKRIDELNNTVVTEEQKCIYGNETN